MSGSVWMFSDQIDDEDTTSVAPIFAIFIPAMQER